MTTRNVFMAGLPDAGKTTFIAALWYLVFSRTPGLALSFGSLENVDMAYLDNLRSQWVQAKKLERTKIGHEKTALINLVAPNGSQLRLSLEDFAGEGFRRMWTRRRASVKVAEQARNADRHLLLVNVGKVTYPISAGELRNQLAGLPAGEEAAFDARKCPTAVQVTDVLQQLIRDPISASPKKIAVALSAWDEVAGDGLSPAEVLEERLPLLSQYLKSLSRHHEIKLYGLRAQGASYEDPAARDKVLTVPKPIDRIVLVEDDPNAPTHDLTRMLAWLLD